MEGQRPYELHTDTQTAVNTSLAISGTPEPALAYITGTTGLSRGLTHSPGGPGTGQRPSLGGTSGPRARRVCAEAGPPAAEGDPGQEPAGPRSAARSRGRPGAAERGEPGPGPGHQAEPLLPRCPGEPRGRVPRAPRRTEGV